MSLPRRLVCLIIALVFVFSAAAQAAGYEYLFENPVLYADGEPVFILENLTVSAGAHDGEDALVTWLDVLAGDNTALRSAVSLSDSGIFASLGGIPIVYGLSGGSIALLSGTDTARAAYALFTPEKIAESSLTLIENVLISLESGIEIPENAPLSAGDTPYTAKSVSGKVDTAAITTAAGFIPAFSGVISAAQVMGKTIPDIGTWDVNGAYGWAGEGESRSFIANITAASGENAYNITLMVDKSASPAAVTFSLAGTDTEMSLSASITPDQYLTADMSGQVSGAWCEAELQASADGDVQFGGGYYISENSEMCSATVICQDGEFYYAISRDIAGVEKNAYFTSDTVLNEDGSRTGIATLGAYDPEGRVELVADLTFLTGDEIGAEKRVDADYPTEILVMTGDAWNNLKTSVVNVVNGAMYVISLHVPGFTYETLDSLDISGLISGEAE